MVNLVNTNTLKQLLDYGLNMSHLLLSGYCDDKYARKKEGHHEGLEMFIAVTTHYPTGVLRCKHWAVSTVVWTININQFTSKLL